MDRLLTVREVSELLQLRQSTIRCWLISGRLKGLRIPGGQWRIGREDLNEALGREVC